MVVADQQRSKMTESMKVPSSRPPTGSTDWAVGCSVHLTTTLGEDIKGTVFAFDRLTNCLMLQEQGETPDLINFRVIRATFIKEVKSARPAQGKPNMYLPYVELPNIDAELALEAVSQGRKQSSNTAPKPAGNGDAEEQAPADA